MQSYPNEIDNIRMICDETDKYDDDNRDANDAGRKEDENDEDQ